VSGFLFSAAALGSLLSGCHRDERFESVCQITRKAVVEVDDKGVAAQVDFELEWDPCPGDQVQIVRGGAEFAKCMEAYNPGDFVNVKVVHFWDSRGYYDWDLYEIAGCARPIEHDTTGSYAKSQECTDTKTHGHTDGFACSLRPFRKLVDVCPWTARD
jgi:hypothetical protein